MSRPDPTDLLCQLRREERGPDAARRLAELLASSPEARLVELALSELDRESQARAGDEVLLSAISDRAILEAAEEQRSSLPRVRMRRRGSRLALAVAAAIVMMGGLAYGLQAFKGLLELGSGAPPVDPSSSAAARVAAPRASATVREESPEPEPPRPTPVASAVAAPLPAASVHDHAARPNAATLFSEANAARRSGREQDAAALYQRLLLSDPGAREAPPSRLALAKLLRAHDPAGSIGHFEILARTSAPFRAEALWGIAGCARALGQRAKERQALTELLEEFPTSPYASTSRARLVDDP